MLLHKPMMSLVCMTLAFAASAQSDTSSGDKEIVYENKQVKLIVVKKKTPKDSLGNEDRRIEIENHDGSKEEIILRRNDEKGMELIVVQESPDSTVKTREFNPESVRVELESVEMLEEPTDSEEDDDLKNFKVEANGFDIGLNNFRQDNGSFDLPEPWGDMRANNARSINFAWNIVQTGMALGTQKLWLISGVGIEYNNYRFDQDIDLNRGGNVLSYDLSDINYSKNKLVSQYLSVPLALKFKSNPRDEDKSFDLETGVQLGYLIGAHQKQKWDDGRTQKRKIRGDYQFSDTRFGVYARLGYGGSSIYVKYYPTPVFKENRGPDTHTVAMGVSINAF